MPHAAGVPTGVATGRFTAHSSGGTPSQTLLVLPGGERCFHRLRPARRGDPPRWHRRWRPAAHSDNWKSCFHGWRRPPLSRSEFQRVRTGLPRTSCLVRTRYCQSYRPGHYCERGCRSRGAHRTGVTLDDALRVRERDGAYGGASDHVVLHGRCGTALDVDAIVHRVVDLISCDRCSRSSIRDDDAGLPPVIRFRSVTSAEAPEDTVTPNTPSMTSLLLTSAVPASSRLIPASPAFRIVLSTIVPLVPGPP